MKTYFGLEEVPPTLHRPLVTLGNFDGFHRGHQFIIREVIARSRESGRPALLVTFRPHPLKVIRPDSAPPLILGHEQKMALIEAAGIPHALVIAFTQSFAALHAETFVREILHQRLDASAVYVGSNFNFGRDREGNVTLLREMGRELGFEVPVLQDFLILGSPVSSSRIRRAVSAGEVELARELLGRPYGIEGEVVHGDGRGESLGFPTANLRTEAELIPADGVYVTRALTGERDYDAVTNVGSRPTFKGASFAVETHILNSPGDLYTKPLEIRFLGRLRQEVKFDSPEQLRRQIASDLARAVRYFAEQGPGQER